MCFIKRWLMPTAFVLTCFLAGAGQATAQKQTRPVPLGGIDDHGGFFSADAVAKAKSEIAEIKRRFKKDLVIETFVNPPAKYKGKDYKEYAAEWSESNASRLEVDGVYVLICKEPRILRVLLGNQTRSRGYFTNTDR